MEKNLQISGMHCHHCVNAVRKALGNLEDVDVISIDIGSAKIRSRTDDESIVAAVTGEGYTVDSIA